MLRRVQRARWLFARTGDRSNSRGLIRCHTWFLVQQSRHSGLECREDYTTARSEFVLWHHQWWLLVYDHNILRHFTAITKEPILITNGNWRRLLPLYLYVISEPHHLNQKIAKIYFTGLSILRTFFEDPLRRPPWAFWSPGVDGFIILRSFALAFLSSGVIA